MNMCPFDKDQYYTNVTNLCSTHTMANVPITGPTTAKILDIVQLISLLMNQVEYTL
jgi:hypothetical protein